ncbi:hypothetical protein C0993_011192, partial [Termitomyces sp. T159_Od127]
MQLNAADTQEAPDPNQTNPNSPTDPHNAPDYADDEEALCMNRFRNQLWINVLEETQEKQQHEGACILCSEQGHFINECPKRQVVGRAIKRPSGLDHEDALNHGPDFDVFSTPATHLHAMALSLDTPSAHLPSQSSQTLLPCTTLPHTSALVSTLVDSSATDNFIDESLAILATTPQKLPLPIRLTLFNGSSTSAGDITHYVQTTLTFSNGQQQDLQLLMTRLHASVPLILGLPWLRSTNPRIDWQNLTLHFDCQAPEPPEPISFDVTAP